MTRERHGERISRAKPWLGLLTHFGLMVFYEYLFLFRLLDYPITPYPGQPLFDIAWLQTQLLVLAVVFALPAYMLASLTILLGTLFYWIAIVLVVLLDYELEQRGWKGNGT